MPDRLLRAAVIVLAAVALAACATAGVVGKGKMRSLLSSAQPEAAVKIVVLNIEAERGTVMVGEGTLGDVKRTPGVLLADRGAGRNEILVLTDLEQDSSYFLEALRPRYRVYVVGEYLRKDLVGD